MAAKTSSKPVENRERFFARLRPHLAPSDLLDIEAAYTLSKFHHRAQTRKGVDATGKPIRYFEHPRHVALILIDEMGIVERDLIIESLLHDGIEDTDLTPELVEHLFGKHVAAVVIGCSKVPKTGFLKRLQITINFRVLFVKGLDRTHNMRTLGAGSEQFRRKQVKETRGHYYHLLDRMVELAQPEYRTHAQWLRDELRRETERQAMLLNM